MNALKNVVRNVAVAATAIVIGGSIQAQANYCLDLCESLKRLPSCYVSWYSCTIIGNKLYYNCNYMCPINK